MCRLKYSGKIGQKANFQVKNALLSANSIFAVQYDGTYLIRIMKVKHVETC